MKRLAYLLPLAVFAVVAVYLAMGLGMDPRVIPSVLINKEVPSFELKPIKGEARGFSNDDLMGQITLVNVFGSWCISCRIEHPFLMGLKERNAIPIYGIDWREEDPDAGPNWLKRFGNPYTVVGDDPASHAAIAFGVTGAPESFLVDETGTIRYKQIGPITPDVWQKTLEPLVRELRRRMNENKAKPAS